jgi:hypothetical protein
MTVARRTDPDTSWEAARSIDRIRESQAAILGVLRAIEPATDEMLLDAVRSASIRMSPSGVRTRRHELVDLGFVRDTGNRVRGATGRRMILWRTTERGLFW